MKTLTYRMTAGATAEYWLLLMSWVISSFILLQLCIIISAELNCHLMNSEQVIFYFCRHLLISFFFFFIKHPCERSQIFLFFSSRLTLALNCESAHPFTVRFVVVHSVYNRVYCGLNLTLLESIIWISYKLIVKWMQIMDILYDFSDKITF